MVLRITLHYSRYYTHLSFLLFIIGFTLPFTSIIKYLILLNSIIVGIAGNLIYTNDYDTFVAGYLRYHPEICQEEMQKQLRMGNFICHTLPLLISFILLPYCTRYIKTYSESLVFFIFFIMSFFTWTLVPYNNMIFQEKISQSYPSTAYSMIITCFVSLFVCLSICFFQ